MTHQENYSLSTSTLEELARNGLKAIPELVRVILNSVMQAERDDQCREQSSQGDGGFSSHGEDRTDKRDPIILSPNEVRGERTGNFQAG